MSNLDIVKKAVAQETKELMREKTIDKITVTEICEKANLKYRNFYRYFRDKFEVVEWIYYHDRLLNSKRYEGWSFWDYFPEIAKYLYDDRKFYLNALKYEGQNSFRNYCIRWLYDILSPDFGPDFPDKETERFYIEHVCNMSFDAFIIWLSKSPCMPPEEFSAFFRQMFLNNANTMLRLLTRPPMEKNGCKELNPSEPSKK